MRFGILSDAHGNVEAFELGLNILKQAGADAIYFLGDSVGYIPNKGVVSALKGSSVKPVRGNHDEMLLRQGATAEQELVYRHRETYAALTDDERDFMRSWPSQASVSDQGATILLVHGSPNDPLRGYVYPDTDLSDLAFASADVIFMGHTHYPFVRQHRGKLFVNVGSCGFPRGDDLRGTVCIFDLPTRSANLIRYDISGSCSRILSRHSLAPSVTALLQRCANYTAGNGFET
jgi:putative phosphoesterase